MASLGKLLVGFGCLLVVVGLAMWLLADKLGWFGHLPGDIRIERPRFHFYAPITTMLIISVLLSLILWLIGRFFR
jgi:hypothetical protein